MAEQNQAQTDITLSVVIITYNEERDIENCLKSVQDIADEIVVLDSFSTDKTPEICEKYGAKFEQAAFDGYVEQKNNVAQFAGCNYLLSMDADEVLSDELKSQIKRLKQNPESEAYSFNRLTFFCGKPVRHCGWYPDTKIRIWKNGTAVWGGTNPHDSLIPDKKNRVKHLKGDLLHYSYHSVEQHITQINKFSTIKAEQALKKGKNAALPKLIFSPGFKFFRSYFLKLGFLDGFTGYLICKNSAHSTFLKYAKLRQLYRK